MTKYFLASFTAFGLVSSVALAQPLSSSATTTVVGPPTSATSATGIPGSRVITPPSAPGTVTTSSTSGQMLHADGDRSLSAGAGASNDQGVSADTIVTTKTYPLSNLITTTTKTTSVNNGVATEKTATTQAYPPMAGFAGSSTTKEDTKTESVGVR